MDSVFEFPTLAHAPAFYSCEMHAPIKAERREVQQDLDVDSRQALASDYF
jgi:hypothetical protein